MAIFRSFSEIVNSILERLRLTQPNLDTKPGTVARDLFIDIQADQLQRLHSSLLLVSEKQSPETANGRDLDRWASNFGISRRPGSPSNGIAVFTVNSLNTDISIPEGTLVTARNEESFRTIGGYFMSVAEKNRFAATANRLRSGLDLAGIADQYAIEIPVRAINPGTLGNISSLQVYQHDLPESMNVTNLSSYSGGSNLESDSSFRARVFAIFSGSNTGTAFGYRSAALSTPGVSDAIVIEPGNTLMLRDGTETIQVNDGSYRILESGTGGKVDLYILGKQLEEVVESYIYTDKSGSGSAADERNDYILGQSTLDTSLTSEERRVQAFKNGILPQQPADSIISVIGTSSGLLTERFVDTSGNVSGNYELIKDTNPETGGSPFGFDKIRFISSEKVVQGEGIIKQSLNSVDPLRFPGLKNIKDVYQDIAIVGENSKISTSDRTFIKLSHSPVTSVSRVTNSTTGEIYVIESQNINPNTGLNDSGEIIISGKTLPSPSDILAVNYVWRQFYDKYIDYNGVYTGAQFVDNNIGNSIDWGTCNGIKAETSIIQTTQDGFEYQVKTSSNISRVTSVYTAVSTTGVVDNVENLSGVLVPGIIIPSVDPAISNIISVTSSSGVEVYNSKSGDGSFYARTIILPLDSAAILGSTVNVFYNKVELFNISGGDGSFSGSIITLPSKDNLESNDILNDVETAELTGSDVYVDYVAQISDISPATSLTLLPINGSELSNNLFTSNLSLIQGSNQPIFYKYTNSQISEVERLGPSRLAVTVSGANRSGKIKINGESLSRLDLEVIAGVSISGLKFNLNSAIKSALKLSTLPTNIGIARVDSVISLDDADKDPDLIGHKLSNNIYGLGVSDLDPSISNYEFILPSTPTNNLLSFSSGERVRVSLLMYNLTESEELYFFGNTKVITDKRFSRVTRISVPSGFRSPAGSLIGSVRVEPAGQPGTGLSYFANYSFTAPIEGERITVRYNLNRLILDVTSNLESVRSITADILVKESPVLFVDVTGEIIVSSDFTQETSTVLDNVSNTVSNLLNSGVLGGTIDYSDIINAATSVNGVDSVSILLFNESGSTGRKSYIKALDNQSISAGQVRFTNVSRKDFRVI